MALVVLDYRETPVQVALLVLVALAVQLEQQVLLVQQDQQGQQVLTEQLDLVVH